ncbi:MAG: hypothetical protein B6I34_10670, partial [Anaerolineaceae bacterium 4572_32.1]
MPPTPTFNALHQTLTARYDLEELRTLCAQLGVPYDDLRGEGRSARARELILRMQRRDRLDELADHYHDPAVPTLKYCVNDVLALERALKELGYTVVTLRDDADDSQWQPTRNNVEARLALLCQSVQPDDLLLVHFACHGHLAQGAPVLVMQDTHITTPAILARQSLPLVEVERQMRGSQARRLVLTLDACHTGVEMGRDLTDPQFIHNVYELAEGFALIAASTAQQIAQEWREKEHGVFTYHLLEGLSGKADRAGKGFVTVDDLKTHVLDGLRRWNVTHSGVLQEPTVRSEGMGDIILANYRSQVGKSSLLSMVCALGPERMGLPEESFGYLS